MKERKWSQPRRLLVLTGSLFGVWVLLRLCYFFKLLAPIVDIFSLLVLLALFPCIGITAFVLIRHYVYPSVRNRMILLFSLTTLLPFLILVAIGWLAFTFYFGHLGTTMVQQSEDQCARDFQRASKELLSDLPTAAPPTVDPLLYLSRPVRFLFPHVHVGYWERNDADSSYRLLWSNDRYSDFDREVFPRLANQRDHNLVLYADTMLFLHGISARESAGRTRFVDFCAELDSTYDKRFYLANGIFLFNITPTTRKSFSANWNDEQHREIKLYSSHPGNSPIDGPDYFWQYCVGAYGRNSYCLDGDSSYVVAGYTTPVISDFRSVYEGFFGRNNPIYSYVLSALFKIILVATFIFLVLIFLIAWFVARGITRYIGELDLASKRIGEGDFTVRLKVRKLDQLGKLAESFNKMAKSIEDLLEESAAQERLRRELEIASEVQRQLFPQVLPTAVGLELAFDCRPAKEVSGDWCDVMLLGNSFLAFTVADVSGKGLPAALIMANLHAAMRMLLLDVISAEGHLPPCALRRVVDRLNQHMVERTATNIFTTCFLAVIDLKSWQFSYINAGHNPALHVRGPATEELAQGGLPLGVMAEAAYETGQGTLGPDELLVCYSDGITERLSADGEFYSFERLRDTVLEKAALPLGTLQKQILHAATGWGGNRPLDDDMTLLIVKRSPDKGYEL